MPMRADVIGSLEALRRDWGKVLIVTSGVRCLYWNTLVGGSPGSLHMQGAAVDLLMPPEDQEKFGLLASKFGFTGQGFGENFCHLDKREHAARWHYPPKH